ncbi:MAG TPA: PilW family protein [Casimicrobiaceae bacterium]
MGSPHLARRFQRGLSLIELMVAITISVILLFGLAVLFVADSRGFSENEKSSQQIENGRYAMAILSASIRHAGFYGEVADVTNLTLTPQITLPAILPDPCVTDLASLRAALPLAVQGVDAPGAVPGCLPDHVAGTDVLVVRRANTTTIPAASAVANAYYTQTGFCATQLPVFLIAQSGFTLQQKDCASAAPIRQYHVEIYFVSPCSIPTGPNGTCKNTDPAVPTLKRLELRPAGDATCPLFAATSWCLVPLVEGIENLQIEYGLDTTGEGSPDTYKTEPASTAEWAQVMTMRLHVLARNVDQTTGFTDTKTYQLGKNADGTDYNVTPGGAYKRHAYKGVVRVTNVSQRKERPLCIAPTTDCPT